VPHERLAVGVPTLVIWGMNDSALTPGLLDGLDAWVPRLTLHREPEASHWIVHEMPERVASVIEAYLRQAPQ